MTPKSPLFYLFTFGMWVFVRGLPYVLQFMWRTVLSLIQCSIILSSKLRSEEIVFNGHNLVIMVHPLQCWLSFFYSFIGHIEAVCPLPF